MPARGANGGAGRQRGERGNDLFFKGVDVEVADGNHGDFFGAIPGVVEVDELLARAVDNGAVLQKAAHDAFWGGYSGYFRDPDGHPWEVVYNPYMLPGPDGAVMLAD